MTLSPAVSISRPDLLLQKRTITERSIQILGSPNFTKDLDSLSGLIQTFDPPSSPILNHLDQKAGDLGTYYLAAFSSAHNTDVAMTAYRTVRSLVRYIFLVDRYFEVADVDQRNLARAVLKNLKDESGSFLRSSITYSLKKFWPFWRFEQAMRKRMLRGDIFDAREVRQLNYSKSSDAPVIYSAVLESLLSDYDYNVSSILHFNQALQDLKDDFDDVAEDIEDKMPNAFILAATLRLDVRKTFSMNPVQARQTILSSGAAADIMRIAQGYRKSVNQIELSEPYWFLKDLSKKYFKDLEDAVAPYLN